MEKKCLFCGNTFYKKPKETHSYWIGKKFCQKICHDKFRTGKTVTNNPGCFKKGITPWSKGKKFPEFSGEKNPMWKPKTPAHCSHCKKELLLSPYQIRARNFCNRSCWALGTRGKGSPVFKGDKATKDLRNRIMHLPEYKYWRIGVFIRDNHKCVLCGSSQQLEADHIKPFALIRVRNKVTNTEEARACQEFWDKSNGRTLCKRCHRKTDTYMKKIIYK